MLEVTDVRVAYGKIEAVKGITFSVSAGEIVALIGANGAGKTTTLRAITGLTLPRAGQIRLEGGDITSKKPHLRVELGMVMVPEGRRIFGPLSVRENLQLGAYSNTEPLNAKAALDNVLTLFPILGNRIKQLAGTLSGGEQQMLAIGRALMARPRLLLLDEPSMGLAPKVVQTIFETIQTINRQGVTVLLVEQNANLALGVAHRALVMETGVISISGTAKEVSTNEDVRRAYLGRGQ